MKRYQPLNAPVLEAGPVLTPDGGVEVVGQDQLPDLIVDDHLQHGLDHEDTGATKPCTPRTVLRHILVHTVELLVEAKVDWLSLVTSLHAVAVPLGREGAAYDLLKHPLAEIGTGRPAEERGKMVSQAWHDTGGGGLRSWK